MKTTKVFLQVLAAAVIVLAAGALSGCGSTKELIKAKPEPEVILNKVENKDFSIAVLSTASIGGRDLDFMGDYNIRIKGDHITSYLPYVGYSYSTPYKGGEGLIFDADIKDYSVEVLDKGMLHVSFDARSPQDNYKFNVYIWSDGTGKISVKPQLKQSATFNGEIVF